MSEPAAVVLIDNATGEPPVLSKAGDQIVCMGTPKLAAPGQYRQLVEVRRLMPVEDAEVAVYDAIESLRGRVEVAAVNEGQGTYRVRAQRLRSAAKVLSAAVGDLAAAVEARK